MKMMTMMDLYIDQLQDMHSAERQLIKALPKLAKAATCPELKQAFAEHLEVTKEQLARLDRIFASLDKSPGRKVCEATVGLVAEGADMIDADGNDDVRDAGLIVAGQKTEHYEISSYGSLRTHAALLGRDADVRLLEKTLEEEKQADQTLNELANKYINGKAMNGGMDEGVVVKKKNKAMT